MAICKFNGVTTGGNERWGSWVILNNITDAMVQFCRKAFGRKYKDMWIYPIYFDDKYFKHTNEFFSEVGVVMYPKITDIRAYFRENGYTWPRTKREWEGYKSVVHDVVYSDLDKNNDLEVEPTYVVIKGVRIPKSKDAYEDRDFIEKIVSIKKVSKLPYADEDYC